MKKSFTLLEIIVVLSIITILMLIGLPVGNIMLENSRDTARKSEITRMKDVFEAYFLEKQELPDHAGCLNSTNFPEIGSFIKNNDYPLDPLNKNEINISGSGVCAGKNEYYYLPLSKGGIPAKSFLLIADPERDGIKKEGYISGKSGSVLATMFASGGGAFEDIETELKEGTEETGKENVYAVFR